jgi:hypothetical protein
VNEARSDEWPVGFVSEILTLLDRIELEEDASLAAQRFSIAEKYGMRIRINGPGSSEDH